MALIGNFTGSALAYALFNLPNNTGDVVRLRRSSDNLEGDFTGGELTDGTALSWIGANNAFVVTIYDQSGNGFHLTQSTSGSQTQIISSGAYIVEQNGIPGLRLNGVGCYAAADGNYGLSDAIYTIQVVETDNTANNMHLFHHNIATGNQRSWLIYYNSRSFITNLSTDGTNAGSSQNSATFGSFTHSTVYIREDQIDASEATAANTLKMWLNGSPVSQTAFSGTAASSTLHRSTTRIRLGGLDSGFFYLGDWFLSVAFPDNKVADRADIYEDVRSIYFDTHVGHEPVATPPPTASIVGVTTSGGDTEVGANNVATPPPTVNEVGLDFVTNVGANNVATPPPTANEVGVIQATEQEVTPLSVATPSPTVNEPGVEIGEGQNVIAYGEFFSHLERRWRVEIWDAEASQAYPETDVIRLQSEGFSLSYESPNDDIHEVIKASKVTFSAVVNPEDALMIDVITEIAQSEEGRFYVVLKEYDGEAWQWYWWGQVITDMIKEPDKWPSIVDISAIDGLGLLANVNYNPIGGGLFNGLDTFPEIIAKLFYRVNMGEAIRGNEHFIKIATNWYNAAMPDMAADPMTYTAIRQEAFWQEEEREGLTTFRPSKGNDVADAVFFGWNARVLLAKGYYHIEQTPLYAGNSILRTVIDKDGNVVSRANEVVERDINQEAIYSTHGGYREWARPLRSAKRIHKHDGSDNMLLPSNTNYATPVTFPYSGLPLRTNTVGEAKRLRVRFFVMAKVTNRTGVSFQLARYLGMRARVRLFDGASTNAYLGKNTLQQGMAWTTDANARYGFVLGPFNYLTAGGQTITSGYQDFETPTFVGDNFSDNKFSLAFGVDDSNAQYPMFFNNLSGPTQVDPIFDVEEIGWNDDPFDSAYNSKLVIQYRCVRAQIFFADGTTNEREYSIEATGSNSTLDYEYPVKIPFGDVVKHQLEPGAFRIWNGSAYESNQNGWGVYTLAGDEPFHSVALMQTVGLRKYPEDRQWFDIYGIIDANKSVSYKGSRYAFIGGTFTASQDRWKGFWQRVGMDTDGLIPEFNDITWKVWEPDYNWTEVTTAAHGFINLINSGVSVGITSAPLTAGPITTVQIAAPNHTGIRAGMTADLIDPTGPVSTKIVIAADVAADATSISIDEITLGQDFGVGSYIVINAVSTADAIGQIYAGEYIADQAYWEESQSTTGSNATVHASEWAVKATSTNADAVIKSKGFGALIRHTPDGTATGGSKRGPNAVDLQTSRTNANEVASGGASVLSGGVQNRADGANSVVSGGQRNRAEGDWSSVVGGDLNHAREQFSVAMGQGAVTRVRGSVAHGSFLFPSTSPGTNQAEHIMLGRITTDDEPTVLTADGLSPSSSNTITIASGEVCTFMIMVQGIDPSSTRIISQTYLGFIQNVAGSTEVNRTPLNAYNNIGENSEITIVANKTDERLDIEVTGVAATTIRWNAIVTLISIKT